MPVRPHGRGLSQAANLRRAGAGRLTLSLMWLAWASRPSLRALSYHFTNSYDATVSGTAYTDHGKVPIRADEVRASGAAEKRRPVLTGENGVGKGLLMVDRDCTIVLVSEYYVKFRPQTAIPHLTPSRACHL